MTLGIVREELRQVQQTQATNARQLYELEKDGADHELRIRSLERWQYALPASLVTSVLTSGVALVAVLWPR